MAMDDNPYRAPDADLARAVGVRSGLRSDLRDVAVAQKGILVCVLLQIVLTLGQLLVPPEAKLILLAVSLVAGLVGTVFVFMLSIKVYNVALGIVFGLLALFPCVGLIVLLVVNAKVTTILQQNGYTVGLLGADLG